MHNGRRFHFCRKCKRWTPNHDTEGHTGGASATVTTGQGGVPNPGTHLSYIEDPSAWLFAPQAEPFPVFWLIVVLFFGGLLGLFFQEMAQYLTAVEIPSFSEFLLPSTLQFKSGRSMGISSCDTSLASSTLPIKGLRRLDGPCTLGMYTTVPPNMPSFSCLVPLTF